jgi:acyl-[acyl-carrier-protein]-phospholipid O-acyltransferase/long-chain-fatty-acid--[acyl-carrier-protein] ligase
MSMSGPSGIRAHLVACAAGASLDNLFRQVAVVALTVAAYQAHAHDRGAAQALSSTYSSWALILFSIPFVVLAPLAGAIGDRWPKDIISRWVRLADVPIVVLGVLGFATGTPWLLLLALGGLAVASSIFAPVKLAIVPELVTPEALARANAYLAAVTVVAILGGACLSALTDLPGMLHLAHNGFATLGWPSVAAWCESASATATAHAWLSLAILIGLCAIICTSGITAAFRLPRLRAHGGGPLQFGPRLIVDQVRTLLRLPGVAAPAIALAGFWALGGVAVTGIAPLGMDVYDFHQAGSVVLTLTMVIGVALGSLLAPRWTAAAFPAGLPIVGAILAGSGLAFAGWYAQGLAGSPLGVDDRPLWPTLLGLFVSGFGAGLWEVPLTVLVQARSPEDRRGSTMASVSVLGSLGTFVAAAAHGALTTDAKAVPAWLGHHTSAQAFELLGGFTVLLAIGYGAVYRLQLSAWVMAATARRIWRVRVHGAERVPQQGGCLVVCNHLSFADGVVMASSLPRPGRFLVYRRYVEMPVVGFFLRAAGVIPVAAEDRRRALLASIDAAVTAASAGECVVIFPEGKLTRSGQTDTFRSGLERIASRANVPVVPAYLHGLWPGPLSRAAHKDWPRLWRPLDLFIGDSLAPTTTAAQARDRVMALSYEHAQERADHDTRTLGSAALTAARRRPFAIAVRDAGGAMSRWKLAAVAKALIPLLGLTRDERAVGVVLPPGRGGAIVNLALALDGRTAVNLNHTAGPAQLARMCELAGIRTIISSTQYLARIGKPELPGRVLHAEDLIPRLGTLRVLRSALGNTFFPSRLRARGVAGDTAAIVFSSGSTGDPKGVELTHRQILANCRSVMEGLDLHLGQDGILSPLPLFHSFGLVPGFWLGLIEGLIVAAHPDPTDGKTLGELCQAARATFLISTPTFARGYLRRTEPDHFKTLRFAVVGAEKCPAELRKQFKEKFGCELLEGYGCTELAPVVSTNLPDVTRDGETDRRTRDGSVGRALPGQHVFTVDPETGAILPLGHEGLLVVHSPARMKGYLGRPDLTEKAFVQGGYATGDIGHVDEDGFIFITGRLARFAKIGGEMVPLDNIEAALQTAVGEACELAIAAVADTARGERLVLLHTEFSGSWETVIATLEHLPPLWRPKPKDARRVDAIPKLGTGKRDLAGIKRLAAERGAEGGKGP